MTEKEKYWQHCRIEKEQRIKNQQKLEKMKLYNSEKASLTAGILFVLIGLSALIGEVRCVVKAVQCDWEAPYKAEIIYTASALTGAGCITGWINIEDK